LSGIVGVQLPIPKASRVIAMLLLMYGSSWANWFGSTVNFWTIAGYTDLRRVKSATAPHPAWPGKWLKSTYANRGK
jgi:hypothetical protein